MRLNNFLILEGETRSHKITEDEVYAFADDYCSDALNGYIKNTSRIFRGNTDLNSSYYIWTSGSERTSPYATNNIYNLLLSNLPSWKKYPKRDLSLVGTTNADSASHYGLDIFIVLPVDNAKIGVCSAYDIWESFSNYAGGTLNDLNISLASTIEKVTGMEIHHGQPKEYNVLLKYFDEIDKWKIGQRGRGVLKKTFEFLPHPLTEKYINNPKVKLMEILDWLLDPGDNGFKLMKSGDNFPENRELWTQDKCILINMKEFYKKFHLKK